MEQHEGVEVLSWATLKELTPLLPRNDLDQPPSRRKIKNAFLLALFYVVFLAGCVFLVIKTVGFSHTLTDAVNTYTSTAPPEPVPSSTPLEIVDVVIDHVSDSSSSSSSIIRDEEPSASPTDEPTESPSEEPTEYPTEIPTIQPTQIPSSSQPSYKPTTLEPTYEPTYEPTEIPTEIPTEPDQSVAHKSNDDYWSSHTPTPTKFPSRFPSLHPSKYPTESPSKIPSRGSDDYWSSISSSTTTNDDYWTKNIPTDHPSRTPTRGALDVFHVYVTPSKYPSHVPTLIETGEAEHHDAIEEENLVVPTYVVKPSSSDTDNTNPTVSDGSNNIGTADTGGSQEGDIAHPSKDEEEEDAAPVWNGPVVVHVPEVDPEPVVPVVVEQPTTIIDISGPFAWVSEWDSKTEKTYYWNTETRQSQWEQPEWLTGVDTKTGKTYYVKTATGESQWEQPTVESVKSLEVPVESDESTVSIVQPVAPPTTAESSTTTTTATTALPLNWIARTDAATGHVYYANTLTGVSQWEQPTVEPEQEASVKSAEAPVSVVATTTTTTTPSEPAAVVETEWLTKLDTKTGKTYYVNTATGISQWEQPTELEEAITFAVSVATPSPSPTPTQTPTAAQAEWLFKIDSKTGKAYYVNTATGVSQWEQPTESEPVVSVAQPVVATATTTAAESTTTITTTESGVVVPVVEPEQSEWLTDMDTKTGKTYYVNTATGISQWEKPTELEQAVTPAESESTASVPEDQPADADEEAEWLFKIDEKTGKAYYVNTATGVSQWEQPMTSSANNVMGSSAASAIDANAGSSAASAADANDGSSAASAADYNDGSSAASAADANAGSSSSGTTADEVTLAATDASTSDGLPPNWHSAVDQKSGRTYYYNTATAESQWTQPEAPLELPSWWLTKVDPANGKTYYVNTVSGVSQWEFPITHQPSSSPVFPPTVQPTMRTMDPTEQPTSRPSKSNEPSAAPSRISMNDIIAISMRDTNRPSLQKTFRPTAISFDLQQSHPTFSPSKKKDLVLEAGTEIPWEQPIDNMVMPEVESSTTDETTDDAMTMAMAEVEALIPGTPTPKPTWMPMSKYPSAEPSVKPSTSVPSVQPTVYTGPTKLPTRNPTMRPTHVPTTALPSFCPSALPSREPTAAPSRWPTTAAFAKAINKATKPTKEPTAAIAATTQEDVGEDMYNYLLSFLSRKLEQIMPGSRKLLLRRGTNNHDR